MGVTASSSSRKPPHSTGTCLYFCASLSQFHSNELFDLSIALFGWFSLSLTAIVGFQKRETGKGEWGACVREERKGERMKEETSVCGSAKDLTRTRLHFRFLGEDGLGCGASALVEVVIL